MTHSRSPLYRLYRTKLTLLAVILLIVGVVLLFVGHNAANLPGWGWLGLVPLGEAGSSLFTFGLVGVALEYLDRKDAEERAMQQLRAALPEQATILRSAVIEGFAASPQSLAEVASQATLDRVAENCLALRLGNQRLAAGVYADLRDQLAHSRGTCSDKQISVALSPWEGGPATGRGSMFVATIRWEYRTAPSSPILRIACTSILDDYRELLLDPSTALAWYFERLDTLDGSSPQVFELVELTVDGRRVSPRRTSRAGTQVLTFNLGREQAAEARDVTLAYTLRVLVQRHSHTLALDIGKPTENLKIVFAYGHCGIRYAHVLDYITSARQPRVSRLPASDPTPSIEVGFDGWVLPKAGVAFVWVLEDEVRAVRR
jgi:hypothetical protein